MKCFVRILFRTVQFDYNFAHVATGQLPWHLQFDCFIMVHIRAIYILQKLNYPLHWCHIGLDGLSNHQPQNCLLNRLFRLRSKKTPKLRVTGLCAWNSPATGEFPIQKISNSENDSIWWRHHGQFIHTLQSECLGPELLLRSDSVASRLANGSAASVWKLRCHWWRGLR